MQWKTTLTTFEDEMPSHILCETAMVPLARIAMVERDPALPALRRLLKTYQEHADALRLGGGIELLEHQWTQRGRKDLRLAPNKNWR